MGHAEVVVVVDPVTVVVNAKPTDIISFKCLGLVHRNHIITVYIR